MAQTNCLFCRIAAGELSAKLVREDVDTVAFEDIRPRAPTHVLVVPRRHIASVNELEAGDAELVGKLFLAAQAIVKERGIAASGYRLVMNVGAEAGQSVDHLHLHVLGGRHLGWPPG